MQDPRGGRGESGRGVGLIVQHGRVVGIAGVEHRRGSLGRRFPGATAVLRRTRDGERLGRPRAFRIAAALRCAVSRRTLG